jgi:RNA polymerase sigma factor (sigma-70 family)
VFAYCRALVRDPADAADAVRDTFRTADSRLDGLRDPGRLRPWLYAIARNQCLHRIRAGTALPAASPLTEVSDETADAGGGAGHARLHGLLRAAFSSLGPGEREVVTLTLWQGLDTAQTADVLGISRHRVQFLLARARRQLAASGGVLLLTRAARGSCGTRDALFAGWDGQLTVALRKRDGFPKPVDPPRSWSRRVAPVPAIAAAVAVVTVVVIALSGTPRGHSASGAPGSGSAGGPPGASASRLPDSGNGTDPAAGRPDRSAGSAPGGRGGVAVMIATPPATAAG